MPQRNEKNTTFSLTSYQYNLPPDRIAHLPVDPPESAKMLVYSRDSKQIEHLTFDNLPTLLEKQERKPVIFFNDTRVIPARIVTQARVLKRWEWKTLQEIREIFTQTEIVRDREIEMLYIADVSPSRFESMVYPGDTFPIGSVVMIGEYLFRTVEITYQGRIFEKIIPFDSLELLEKYGHYPLPPYITPSSEAEALYNTEFAKHKGSLAAPTASLHFTNSLIDRLIDTGVKVHYLTLHVGIGTFKIMNSSDIRHHTMHPEWASISGEIFDWIYQYKKEGRPILAVGTTMVRLLESLPDLWRVVEPKIRISDEGREYWNTLTDSDISDLVVSHISVEHTRLTFETQIFIMPGYQFRVVDQMITNFHLPESTLLAMVGAFMGLSELHDIYQTAISKNYRFYSFGDGMYIC